MAIELSGTVIGRQRRITSDLTPVVTLKVLAGEQVHHVQWWRLQAEEAPAVGEVVTLPINVRAYTDRNGTARIGMTVEAGDGGDGNF